MSNKYDEIDEFLKTIANEIKEKDESLTKSELYGRLASFGINYSEEELDAYGKAGKSLQECLGDKKKLYKKEEELPSSAIEYKDGFFVIEPAQHRKPQNVQFIKIYTPIAPENIFESGMDIIEFLSKNYSYLEQKDILKKINNEEYTYFSPDYQTKIARDYRADNIVTRVLDVKNAKIFVDFINKNLGDKLIKTNPFMVKDGKIGFAMDGTLSYNERVANYIHLYMLNLYKEQKLDEASLKDFYNFIKQKREEFYEKDNGYLKALECADRFYITIKEPQYLMDNKNVMDCILLALDRDKNIEDFEKLYTERTDPKYIEENLKIIDTKLQKIHVDNGYNKYGYDDNNFNYYTGLNKYTDTKYGPDGYDKDGYDEYGFSRYGIHKITKEKYDLDGFDSHGIYKKTRDYYNEEGYDRDGFDYDGYNREGYDKEGYDKEGFNKTGFNIKGFDREGFNILGFDKNGFDKNNVNIITQSIYDLNGYDKERYKEEQDREVEIEKIKRELSIEDIENMDEKEFHEKSEIINSIFNSIEYKAIHGENFRDIHNALNDYYRIKKILNKYDEPEEYYDEDDYDYYSDDESSMDLSSRIGHSIKRISESLLYEKDKKVNFNKELKDLAELLGDFDFLQIKRMKLTNVLVDFIKYDKYGVIYNELAEKLYNDQWNLDTEMEYDCYNGNLMYHLVTYSSNYEEDYISSIVNREVLEYTVDDLMKCFSDYSIEEQKELYDAIISGVDRNINFDDKEIEDIKQKIREQNIEIAEVELEEDDDDIIIEELKNTKLQLQDKKEELKQQVRESEELLASYEKMIDNDLDNISPNLDD